MLCNSVYNVHTYSKFLSLPPVPPISLSLYGHVGYTYMYSEHLVLPTLLKGNWRKLISMNFFFKGVQ